METQKINSWLLTNLNGLLAIIIGAVALFFPALTLVSLAIYFAIAIILGGLVLIYAALRVKKHGGNWNLLFPEALITLAVGILVLTNPTKAATVFILLIGIWALITGSIILFMYLSKQTVLFNRQSLLLTSLLFLAFGLVIVINPFESSRVITVIIGVYLMLYGVVSMINHSKHQYYI